MLLYVPPGMMAQAKQASTFTCTAGAMHWNYILCCCALPPCRLTCLLTCNDTSTCWSPSIDHEAMPVQATAWGGRWPRWQRTASPPGSGRKGPPLPSPATPSAPHERAITPLRPSTTSWCPTPGTSSTTRWGAVPVTAHDAGVGPALTAAAEATEGNKQVLP